MDSVLNICRTSRTNIQKASQIYHQNSSYKGLYTTHIRVKLFYDFNVCKFSEALKKSAPEISSFTHQDPNFDYSKSFSYYDLSKNNAQETNQLIQNILEGDRSLGCDNVSTIRFILIKVHQNKSLLVCSYGDWAFVARSITHIINTILANYASIPYSSDAIVPPPPTATSNDQLSEDWGHLIKNTLTPNNHITPINIATEKKCLEIYHIRSSDLKIFNAIANHFSISRNLLLQCLSTLISSNLLKLPTVSIGVTRESTIFNEYNVNTLPVISNLSNIHSLSELINLVSSYNYLIKQNPNISIQEIKESSNLDTSALELFNAIVDIQYSTLYDMLDKSIIARFDIRDVFTINETHYPIFLRYEIHNNYIRLSSFYSREILGNISVNDLLISLIHAIDLDIKNTGTYKIYNNAFQKYTCSKSTIYANDNLNETLNKDIVQSKLLSIWKNRLNLDIIDVDDNFFALGGDSLRGIQVVMDCKSHHINFSAHQIYEYPTIRLLAEFICSNKTTNSCSSKSASQNLNIDSPIQQWFYDKQYNNNDIWCLTQNFYITSNLNIDEVCSILINTLDSILPDTNFKRDISSHKVQCKICHDTDYSHNTLSKWIHDDNVLSIKDNRTAAFIIRKDIIPNSYSISLAIHHLVVDGFSWSIIFQQLNSALNNQIVGVANNFKIWLNDLNKNKHILLDEADVWNKILNNVERPKINIQSHLDKTRYEKSKSITVPKSYQDFVNILNSDKLSLNDLLIAASLKLSSFIQSSNKAAIIYESHGRANIHDHIDLSSSIGWFTSMYPLSCSDISDFPNIQILAKHCRQTQRDINHLGHSYLYNYHNNPDVDYSRANDIYINLNYWGIIDQNNYDNIKLTKTPYLLADPDSCRPFPLYIESSVKDNSINITLKYSTQLFSDEQIDTYISYLQNNLLSIFTDNSNTYYPLSNIQSGILYDSLLYHDDTYMVQSILKYTDAIDLDLLRKSCLEVINHNSYFNMNIVFDENNSTYKKSFKYHKTPNTNIIKKYNIDKNSYANDYNSFLETDRSNYFDLENDCLIRFNILCYRHCTYLVITHHHILIDGWSFSLLINDIHKYYNSYVCGIDIIRPKPIAPYFPTIEQHNNTEYWQNYLNEHKDIALNAVSMSSISHQNRTHNNVTTLEHSIKLPDGLSNLLINSSISLFSFLTYAWSLTLFLLNHTNDISFGIVSTKRANISDQNEHAFDMNINTLPIIMSIGSDINVLDSIKLLNKTILNHTIESNVSINDVLGSYEFNIQSLTTSIIAFDNYPLDIFNQHGAIKVDSFDYKEKTNTPIYIMISQLNQLYHIKYSYQNHTIDDDMANTVFNQFITNIAIIYEQISKQNRNINFISSNQEELYYHKFYNYKPSPLEHLDNTLSDVFVKFKNNIAIEFQDEQMSYQLLHQHINILSKYIDEHINEHDIILYFNRSPSLIISILACWNTGKTIIPISSTASIEQLLASGERCILSDIAINDSINIHNKYYQYPTISINSNNKELDTINFDCDNAYVLYTSGTTGKPKGVSINHTALSNVIQSIGKTIDFNSSNSFLFSTDISFDISFLEMLVPLYYGGKIVISNSINKTSIDDICKLIDISDYIQFTPTSLNQIIKFIPKHSLKLKNILIGGEHPSTTLTNYIKEYSNQAWQCYGPTECTIWITIRELSENDDIGFPLQNNNISIVTPFKQIVPPGFKGECLISGINLANGYLDHISDHNFIQDHDTRYYATGDIVTWQMEKNTGIKYIGRNDQEIKYSGKRINLDAISKTLTQNDALTDAHAFCDTSSNKKAKDIYIIAKCDDLDLNIYQKINFSLQVFPTDNTITFNEYVEIAEFIDKNKLLNAIWLPERHFDKVGSLFPRSAIVASALATKTSHIQLRSGSIILPLDSPIRIAEDWSLIDNISNGRAGLAVSSGWHPRDFVINPNAFDRRKEYLKSGILEIQALLDNKSVSYKSGDGKDYAVSLYPKPVNGPLPIWIAVASDPNIYAFAGKHGLNILTHLLIQDIDDLHNNIQIYHHNLEKYGHNKEDKDISVMLHSYFKYDNDQAIKESYEHLKNYLSGHSNLMHSKDTDNDEYIRQSTLNYINHKSLIGSPENKIDFLEHLYSIGVTSCSCLMDFGHDKPNIIDSLSVLQEACLNNSGDQIKNNIIDILNNAYGINIPIDNIKLTNNIPTHSNGKFNKDKAKHLFNQASHGPSQSNIIPALRDIWIKVLQVSNVNDQYSFFQNGGNSLHTVSLIKMLEDNYDIKVSIADIFSHPTLAKMSDLISSKRDNPQLQHNSKHIEPANSYDLSELQKGIYVDHSMNKDSHRYNDTLIYKIDTIIDDDRLTLALQYLLGKHPLLRCYIDKVGSKISLKECGLDINEIINHLLIYTHKYKVNSVDDIASFIDSYARKPFLLNEPPLFRIIITPTIHDETYLTVVMHHIICDGLSHQLFINDFINAYTNKIEYTSNTQYSWPPIGLDNETRSYKEFWLNYIKNQYSPLKLPTPNNPINEIGYIRETISNSIYSKIKKYSVNLDTTVFTLLFSVYAITLSKFFKSNNVTIGTPFTLKHHENDIIGPQINLLPVITHINHSMASSELIENIKHNLYTVYSNASYPFRSIINDLNTDRSYDNLPLIQTIFEYYENNPLSKLDNKYTISLLEPICKPSLVDLSFWIVNNNNQLTIYFKHNKMSIESEVAHCLIKSYINMLEQLLHQDNIIIGNMSILDNSTKDIINNKLNRIPHIKSNKSNLASLLKYTFSAHPKNTALVYKDTRLSYCELERLVNKAISSLAIHNNNSPLVGIIYADNPIDVTVSILAMVVSGITFLPLSRSTPLDRLITIANDANASFVITDLIDQNDYHLLPISIIDTDNLIYHDNISSTNTPDISAQDPAYIIYTSGTTGKPKGVCISHNNVINTLLSINNMLSISENDVSYNVSQISFDLSIYDIFGIFLSGGCLAFPTSKNPDPFIWLSDIAMHGVTIWNSAPALAQLLVDAFKLEHSNNTHQNISTIHNIMLSGDRISPKLIQELNLHFNADIYALGGATEASIWSNYHKIDKAINYDFIPYGTALDNQSLYVLDENLQQCPPEVEGELYIGGLGVALGYWNDTARTNNSFIYHHDLNERLYKTGDIVKYKLNGYLQIIGRTDNQIKINGYRIELGDIESNLRKIPWINDALAMKVQDESNTPYLVSFIDLDLSNKALTNESSQWKDIYNDLYQNYSGNPYQGWIDSRSKEKYSNMEMLCWINNTISKLLPFAEGDIYEFGCGTGMILDSLKNHCTNYYAYDISTNIIKHLKYTHRFSDHISLNCADLSSINNIPHGSANLIVLNSVSQYLPSKTHLLSFILKAIKVLKSNGTLYIGDVICPTLARDNHIHSDTELYIDKVFFTSLHLFTNKDLDVEISRKNYFSNSEMSISRYDVIIRFKNYSDNIIDISSNQFTSKNTNINIIDKEELPVIYTNLDYHQSLVLTELYSSNNNYLIKVYNNSDKSYDIAILNTNCKYLHTNDPTHETSQMMNGRFEDDTRNRVKQHLVKNIPSYMLPKKYIFIDFNYININGKLDRQKLINICNNTKFSTNSKRNQDNNHLVSRVKEAWEHTLNNGDVDINISFFEAGGDSITALQLISRLHSLDLHIDPKNFYDNLTIIKQAAYFKDNNTLVKPLKSNDAYVLHPIQDWLVNYQLDKPSHWNQAFIFKVDYSILNQTIIDIVLKFHETHSTLSHTINNDMQINTNCKPVYRELSYVNQSDTFEKYIDHICIQEQKKLDINNGPISRFIIFTNNHTMEKRLLLIIHNLFFDGYSWRIFVDDFIYLSNNIEKPLAPEITSYREWIMHLKQWCNTSKFQKTLSYWNTLSTDSSSLSLFAQDFDDTYEHERFVTKYISSEIVSKLKSLDIAIDAIFLSCLYQSLEPYLNTKKLTLNIEKHGREHIDNTFDLSRTTGWFTALFPFSITQPSNSSSLAKQIHEDLNAIPYNGVGFAAASTYLNDKKQRIDILNKLNNDICYNFFGSFDESLDNQCIEYASEAISGYYAASNRRPHKLHVNLMIINHQLRIDFRYPGNIGIDNDIEKIANNFVNYILNFQ